MTLLLLISVLRACGACSGLSGRIVAQIFSLKAQLLPNSWLGTLGARVVCGSRRRALLARLGRRILRRTIVPLHALLQCRLLLLDDHLD